MAGEENGPPLTEAGEPISEAEALRRLRQTDDQSLQYYAAWWLGRMRSHHPDTVPLLRSALRQRQPHERARQRRGGGGGRVRQRGEQLGGGISCAMSTEV